MVENKQENIKAIRRNSIILALLITSNLLANTISIYIVIPNIYAYIIITLFILSILKNGFKVNIYTLFIIFIILLEFAFSFVFVNSETTKRFLICFLSVAIPSLVISNNTYNFIGVLKATQIISIFCLPYYIKVITTDYTIYDSGHLMGLGYAILPIILFSLSLFFHFPNINIIWKVISVFNLVVLSMISTKMLSRGFFACIAAYIFIEMCIKLKEKPRNLFIFLIFTVFLVTAYFAIFRKYIIDSEWYYYIFEMKAGNFLNGRELDIQMVLEKKPLHQVLFGKGIGSFKKDSGFDYIHNILGMIYYEQGIIVALMLFILICKSIFKILRGSINEQYNLKLLMLILLASSICKLMVSYYFWIDQLFWIYVSLSMKILANKN